jgi:subtilisin family serine protease
MLPFDLSAWHDNGFSGAGVTVAVVDVGFDGYADRVGGLFAAPVTTDFVDAADESAHGTAAAEVIRSIAPNAGLRLVQVNDAATMLDAVDRLGDVDVVSSSIGFTNDWAADGQSDLSLAVAALTESGVVWVNAAGNGNLGFRGGSLSDDDGDRLVEIDGLEGVVALAPGGVVDANLLWSHPRVSLNLLAVDADGVRCGSAAGDGRSARLHAQCDTELVTLYAVQQDGTANDRVDGLSGSIFSANGLADGAWSDLGSIASPADAEGVIAVGTCVEGEAPAFSARGPTLDGRIKPDLCALDGLDTDSYGPGNFTGTSASAPVVAGLAALALDAGVADGPGMRRWLASNARDLGESGADDIFGAGEARPGRAPAGCATVPGAGAGAALLAAVVVGVRRRGVASR